ncbi:MAG: hypothetical protein E6356_16490 [Terrisporobacter othiniensis]|uniref:hypothetical protein n=1 Tax=Terrisporobacter petrolearius TaxID=1460447 RepID=UPI0022DF994C|nr:hypothetical protein [Terrisporobacter petrolearius]MDU4859875.1 hypothetical protein [Terrisporobacter othiniensis]MDU6996457.1 hypothetical protein [Terrisporobacter othiniensis]
MANKIWTLFEVEFKRIQKIYFALLTLLFFSNAGLFSFLFNLNLKESESIIGYKVGMSVLKEEAAIEAFSSSDVAQTTYQLTFFLLIGALLWCLYYGLAIWYKDFSNKTKPIYTLFMLPENKFIIFISKLITMLTLIYGVILVQFLCWLIMVAIMKNISGISIEHIINIINNARPDIYMIYVPQISRVEFIMIFILGPILAMTVLFTGIMMHKTVKKIGGLLGVIYVISIISVYFSITALYNTYSDVLMKTHLIFYLVVFVMSMVVSYSTLTKKIYV